MKHLLLFGLTLLAAPAAAQQNTQCSTTFGITNCTTTGSASSGGVNRGAINPNAYQQGYDRSKAAVDGIVESFRQGERDREQREQALLLRRQAEQSQALAQQNQALAQSQAQAASDQQAEAKARGIQAGKLVAAGDCAGAARLALEAGDLELANAVKAYCSK
jgi:hypothetical protein